VELSEVQQRFVVHWGEMGTRWGVNRTVAQIHALLYIWPQPLHADQITEALGVARSNVSNSIRELQSWGIVSVANVLGDRRDYFTTLDDVWELFATIMDERKKREIDPTLAVLRECVEQARTARRPDEATVQRLKNMLEFFESTNRWYESIRKLPRGAMRKFIRMGDQCFKGLRSHRDLN
jgi:DNA-binding transcriptional regulator GbsR (MarR family)